MFWGLIMEPGKKYSQTVQKSFHISHAALDLDTASMDPVQVLLGFDSRNYLVCTLQKGKWIQAPLDLNFQVGDSVSFATNGPGHVHLTGYLVPEDDYDMQEEEEESDEEVPELVPAKKRKALENNKTESVAKKSKTALLLDEINTEDSDDSDDSDVNLTDMLEGDEEAEDEESAEEEEGDDDDDDEEDDDDDDNDEELEEDESDDEEEKVQAKSKKDSASPVKQNGVAKKEKGQKANQAPNKQEKQGKQVQQNEKQQKGEKSPKSQKGTPAKRTIEGGVIVEDLKVGDGQAAKHGKVVQVYYEGRLKSNNKMFDSSTKGPGFKFRLGRKEVIKGWDVGLAGMQVGGKRRITIPPNMAYGAQGSPPVIPPGSTLIFEVELKNVKN